MAHLANIPGYVHLAREAATILGNPHDDIVAAILAQWTCEQPDPTPWPPIHNNPGNLTRHIGTMDQEPHALAHHAPGAGLLYVYPSPDAGARAFAHYLINSRRYHGALRSLRAGEERAFLEQVCRAGYGTRLSCALHALNRIHVNGHAPAGHRWRCEADRVNVREAAHVEAAVVGFHTRGAVIDGVPVTGGAYHGPGGTSHAWLRTATGHYTAAAFYHQVS